MCSNNGDFRVENEQEKEEEEEEKTVNLLEFQATLIKVMCLPASVRIKYKKKNEELCKQTLYVQEQNV